MKATIAKAVRHHLFMSIDDNFPPDEEEMRTLMILSAQLAINIYTEHLGELHLPDLTGTELREFLADCGISDAIAHSLVSDDEPLAIY